MKFFCRHCDEPAVGKPYRVVSEENGVVLLNMTVCRSCCEKAKALGLRAEPVIQSRPRRNRLRWGEVSVAASR